MSMGILRRTGALEGNRYVSMIRTVDVTPPDSAFDNYGSPKRSSIGSAARRARPCCLDRWGWPSNVDLRDNDDDGDDCDGHDDDDDDDVDDNVDEDDDDVDVDVAVVVVAAASITCL